MIKMAFKSGKSRQSTSNGDRSLGPHADTYSLEQCEESPPEITCKDCLRYWSFNFLVNGMFTTSRIVGYTQFMVFMILRVIICGSLCGRAYGDDPETTNCSFIVMNGMKSRSLLSLSEEFNVSSVDIESYDVRATCLSIAYWNVSPITLWALSLLTVILPWLILLPWTPLGDDQDFIVCGPTKIQWPCLTIYVVRFMKACIRLALEFSCTIAVPIIYGLGIPDTVTCYRENIVCSIQHANEKTIFLWLFVGVNVISTCLTVWEVVDICQNKHFYETDKRGYASSNKLSSNRSSAATMLNATPFDSNKGHPAVERGRTKKRSIVNRVASKRRMGRNRCSEPDIIVYEVHQRTKGKFKGRVSREADGDEVIKLAAPTPAGKTPGYHLEELEQPAGPKKKEAAGALVSAINEVILHDAPIADNCLVHATSNGAEPAEQ